MTEKENIIPIDYATFLELCSIQIVLNRIKNIAEDNHMINFFIQVETLEEKLARFMDSENILFEDEEETSSKTRLYSRPFRLLEMAQDAADDLKLYYLKNKISDFIEMMKKAYGLE